jgi:hypothetical protein
MPSRESTKPNRDQTIAQARAERAENAIAAALYAHRVEKARATARYAAMARWTAEYQRSVATCRQLGDIIRSDREAA